MLVGDASNESVLRQAGIERAAGLVAATTTDAANTYIVLAARSLNSKLKIIARASEEDAEKHLRSAGADEVVSPYSFIGYRIAHSFLRPNVLDFMKLAMIQEEELGLDIEEVRVGEGSAFAGKTIRTSKLRQDFGIIVLAIKREGQKMQFNPKSTDPILAGDYLVVMGDPAKLREVLSWRRPRMKITPGHQRDRRCVWPGSEERAMKITTAAEMREIDRLTTERFGVHSLTLMENAGTAVATFAREHFAESSRIAIVCGKGNNGGDGFVAARKLHQAGKVVEVLLLADPAELRGDAAKMFARLPFRPVVIATSRNSPTNFRAVSAMPI